MPMQHFIQCEKAITGEKNPILPIEKFPSLVLPSNAIMLQHLIIQFLVIICQVVAYGRLKAKQIFKVKWSCTPSTRNVRLLARGAKYSDLDWKLLVFLKTGYLGEVAAYERWSQPEVRRYFV